MKRIAILAVLALLGGCGGGGGDAAPAEAQAVGATAGDGTGESSGDGGEGATPDETAWNTEILSVAVDTATATDFVVQDPYRDVSYRFFFPAYSLDNPVTLFFEFPQSLAGICEVCGQDESHDVSPLVSGFHLTADDAFLLKEDVSVEITVAEDASYLTWFYRADELGLTSETDECLWSETFTTRLSTRWVANGRYVDHSGLYLLGSKGHCAFPEGGYPEDWTVAMRPHPEGEVPEYNWSIAIHLQGEWDSEGTIDVTASGEPSSGDGSGSGGSAGGVISAGDDGVVSGGDVGAVRVISVNGF